MFSNKNDLSKRFGFYVVDGLHMFYTEVVELCCCTALCVSMSLAVTVGSTVIVTTSKFTRHVRPADVAFPILHIYLIRVDFVEDRPLQGSREQVVELAHRDAFAELVEIEKPIAVGVVQLTAVARNSRSGNGLVKVVVVATLRTLNGLPHVFHISHQQE